MKKRLFGILLSFALMLTMMPVLGLSQPTLAADITGNTDYSSINDGDVIKAGATISGDNGFWLYVEDDDITTGGENATVTEAGKYSAFGTYFMIKSITAYTDFVVVNKTKSPSGEVDVLYLSEGYPIWVGGEQVTPAKMSGQGWSYTPADGSTEPATPAKLTLNGFNYDGQGYEGAAIYAEQDLTIELNGENTVKATDYGVRVKKKGKDEKFNLAICGSGSLSATGAEEGGIDNFGGNISIDSSKVISTSDAYGIHTDGGIISIDGSEIEAVTNDDDAICGIDVNLNNSNITTDGSYAIYATNIDIVDCKMDGSKGAIYADGKLAIKDSIVKNEAVSNVLQGEEGINIEYTGSGKYSTYVEATAKGMDSQMHGTSEDEVDLNKVAVWAKENSLTIDDDLAVTAPEEGRIDDFEAKIEEMTFTFATVVDSKGNPADHVIITIPEPDPTPAAKVPTIKTTASVSAGIMTVKWSWNKVKGAKSYKVAYRKAGSKKWKTKKTKKTELVIKGHKIRGLYEYKVAAVTSSGNVWSKVRCRYFNNVRVEAKAGKGNIKVSWKKDKKASGYQVLIATNKKMKNAQKIPVDKSAKSYKISGLEKGKTYYVKVRPMKTRKGVAYKGVLCKAIKLEVK